MTRTEAFAAADAALAAFRMADYHFLAGRGGRPDPAAYGLSGTIRQPGNTITIAGHAFHVDEIHPATHKVHAGF